MATSSHLPPARTTLPPSGAAHGLPRPPLLLTAPSTPAAGAGPLFSSSLPLPRGAGSLGEDPRDLLPKLTQETELHKMLADEKMRAEQHRTNYQTVKAEHTRLQDEYVHLQTELRSTIEESRLVQEKYQTILEELRNELAEKHREAEDAKSQTLTSQRLDMVRLELRDELDHTYRERYQRLDTEVDRYRGEYNKLKYEFSFLKTEYEHEKVEGQRVVDEMRLRHEAEVTNLRTERETLISRQQADSSSDSSRSRTLQRENTAMTVQLKGVLAELEEVRAQREHAGMQTDNVTRLQNKQLVENNVSIKALETERESLKLQVSSLQKELSLGADLHTQLSSRTHELEKDNIVLKNRAEETTHKAKVELTNAKMDALRERGELERERDRLNNTVEELRTEVEIQKASVDQHAEALVDKEQDTVRRVQAAREEEWAKLRELQNDKIDLEAKLQEIERRKIDETSERHNERDKFEERLQTATDRRQEAEKELCVARTKLQHQASLLESLERERAENAALKTRTHRLETDAATDATRLRDLEDEARTAKRQLDEATGDLNKARDSLRTSESDADRTLSQHRASWLEEKSGYQRRVDELEDQLMAAQAQSASVVAGHKKKKAYTSLITKLKQKLSLTQAKLEQLTIEREALKRSVPSEAHLTLKKQLAEMMRRHRDYRMLLLASETKEVNIGSLSFMSAAAPTAIPTLDTDMLKSGNYNYALDLEQQHRKDLELLKTRLDTLDDHQRAQLHELRGVSPGASPRLDDITHPEKCPPEKDGGLLA